MSPKASTCPNPSPHISGYAIVQHLYAGPRSNIYRAIEQSNQRSVIVKLLQQDYPSLNDLLQFRNQYTIAQALNLPGIVRPYDLKPYGHSYALVMEHFESISLKKWIENESENKTHSLGTALAIAIQLASILDDLYHQCVIHKDIKPSNILIHPVTHQVKLTNFGLATLLTHETQTLICPNLLEGTLAYLAPEQTGRMNRGIDYRTDLYALGVTLFELLTGTLPFPSDDLLELVHCHLAQSAPSVCDLKPELPKVMGQIVAKLMAKNAEDRYQSALGLKHDLEIALTQLNTTGKIESFPIASQDLSDRLLLPEKLYGREKAVNTLLTAFERVSQGSSEMMLVAGFSGIGKTAVVNEVHKPIARQRGYFVKGKYDQFQHNIPFSALMQVFRDLMGQLLCESDEQLQSWKTKILEALGDNGQVLIEVIPELERVIGQQPPATELSGSAAQNRFHLLVQKFIKIFPSEEHPFVMFIDDLQWADSASLNLLKVLMQDTHYLLVLGAYRDNEVFPSHSFIVTVDEMVKAGAIINTLLLQPLKQSELNQWVADTLNCDRLLAQPLTELVYQKTKGNPFFATQFLKSLYDEHLIRFDREMCRWQCDIDQVRALMLTDDVVEFIAAQLQKLPNATQNSLKLAACIGAQFDLQTLTIVSKSSDREVASALWKAVQEGLIIPNTEVYKFFTQSDPITIAGMVVNPSYRFLHDRVQQAAYSLIPEDQKQITHYQIGQLLLQQLSSQAKEECIFELVNQLNYGTAFILHPKDREELAKLNLIACRKAKSATAYQAGRDYARVGLSLLGETAWQQNYALTLSFHDEATELASLCGDFEAMEQWVEMVIAQTHSLLDKVNVYRVKVQADISQTKLTEALESGTQLLQQLGVTLPETLTPKDIQQSIQEINDLIGDRELEAFVQRSAIADPHTVAIIQVANSLMGVAYVRGSPLFPLLTSLAVKLSLQHGNISASASSYACYSIIACNLLQDVALAIQFSQLALNVVLKLDAKAIKPGVLMLVGAFVQHRNAHIKETLPLLSEGYTTALEVGSPEYAGYSSHCFCLSSFWCSQPLAVLEQSTRNAYIGLVKINQLTTANYCRIYWQSILNLLGHNEHPTLLFGAACQETEFLPILLSANDLLGLFFFYLHKLNLYFLFGEVELANHHAFEARNHLVAAAGTVGEPAFYFYDSLIALALLNPEVEEDISPLLERVAQNQQQLRDHWAYHAPMNHQHKVDLVAAEEFRVLGQKYEAADYYDRAIAGAKINEFTNEAALANELAAKFYLGWGKEKVAAGYMQEAYYCYARWGANAKIIDLETCYPNLLSSLLQNAIQQPQVLDNTTYLPSQLLDISSAVRSTQAISEEIVLQELLSKLIQVILVNAGATKSILLLPNNQQMTIVAIATHDSEQVALGPFLPIELSQDLPLTIINSVHRHRSPLILDVPQGKPYWATDPYWQDHPVCSVLCMPLLKQGKLVGLLYLENQLTLGAFTRDRVELLNLLCTQAAISIENAQLYQSLQESENKFRTLVENVNDIFYTIALDETFTYLSPQFKTLLGYEVSQFLYQPFRPILHPDDTSVVIALHQELFKTGEKQAGIEFRVRHQNGEWRWLACNNSPMFDDQGDIIGLRGIARDISQRKNLEQEQVHLLAILEASSDFIGTANPDGKITWVNSRFKQFYDVTPESHFDGYQSIKDFHPQWAADIVLHEGIPHALQNNNWQGETALLTPDGQEIPVSQVIMSHKSSDGVLEYLSTIIRDISDRKAAEEQLKHQAQQLEQANQQLEDYSQTLEHRVEERTAELKSTQERLLAQERLAALGTLTAGIAHELCNPLNFVKNYAEGSIELTQDLQDILQPISEAQTSETSALIKSVIIDLQENATTIRNHSQRAEQIIVNMMQHSRSDTEQTSPQPTPLHDLLNEAVQLSYRSRRSQNSNFPLKIYTDYDASIDVVEVVPSSLIRAFINLIDNACDAMMDFQQNELNPTTSKDISGYVPTLIVSTRQAEGQVEIRIRDNGSGISPSIQSRILDPFFTTKPPGKGTGLGLSIAYEILVKQHQGAMTINSNPSEFTEIVVALPHK